jgi:hypothetical protein
MGYPHTHSVTYIANWSIVRRRLMVINGQRAPMAYFVRQQCIPASGFYQAFYFPAITSGKCTVYLRWFGKLWPPAAHRHRPVVGCRCVEAGFGASLQPRTDTPARQHGSKSSSTGATHTDERPTAVNNPNTSDWDGGNKTPHQRSVTRMVGQRRGSLGQRHVREKGTPECAR